jgi:hypothetical protein
MSLFRLRQAAISTGAAAMARFADPVIGHPSHRRTGLLGWHPVLVTAAVLACLGAAAQAAAQGTAPTGADRPFEITDNSFLVEEAFNQEPGIFQNIVTVRLDSRDEWEASLTQEWPLFSQAHQISFTLPFTATGGESGVGDLFVHYRFQAVTGGGRAPAFSPRVSLVLASGSASRGLGSGNPGWQVNLPFSKQVRDWYFHWNGGFTHFPSAESGGTTHSLFTPHVAASAIWRAKPMLNLMIESVVEWDEQPGAPEREAAVTVMPGVRTGWNAGETQTVFGAGLPVHRAGGTTDVGVFLYASYELPFVRQ